MPPSKEEIAIESQSNGADNDNNNNDNNIMQNIPTNSASLTANSDMPFPDVGQGSFPSDAGVDDTDADADDIFTQLDISLTSLDQFKLLLNSDLLDKLGVSSLEELLDDSFYNEDASGVDNNMAGEEDEEDEYSDTSQPLSTIESINYDWEDDGSSAAADSGTVQQAQSNETVDKQNTAKLIDMNDRKTPLPSTKPSKLIDMGWPKNRTRGRPRSKPQEDDLKESESPQNKPSSPPPQQSNQSQSSGGTAKLIDMEWPKNKRGNRGTGRRKDSTKSSPNKQPSPPSQQFSSSQSSDEGHDRKSRKQRQMGKMLKDEKPNSNYEKKASSSSQTLSITTSSEGDSTTASEPKIKKKVEGTTKPSTTITSRRKHEGGGARGNKSGKRTHKLSLKQRQQIQAALDRAKRDFLFG